MIINKNWDLQNAFDAINAVYYPGGLQSGPQRNRKIESWGQLVGKEQAIAQLDSLLQEHGTLSKLSKAIRMSPRSINQLRIFFESLPDQFELTIQSENYQFVEGKKCLLEEDLTHEFKEVKGLSPTNSIQNQVDEYIIAFLNSSGGSIFWGICDDGVVKCLKLNTNQKDEINKVINAKINVIQPSIDPTKIRIIFHLVLGVESGFVLEVKVPKSNNPKLFFNSSGKTWVRVNGCKQKLQGLALQDYIIERMQPSL